MAIILKDNKVNLFVFSVLFIFWYHSPNVLDTPHTRICDISRLSVKNALKSYRKYWYVAVDLSLIFLEFKGRFSLFKYVLLPFLLKERHDY
jgi:hypothetical protein